MKFSQLFYKKCSRCESVVSKNSSFCKYCGQELDCAVEEVIDSTPDNGDEVDAKEKALRIAKKSGKVALTVSRWAVAVLCIFLASTIVLINTILITLLSSSYNYLETELENNEKIVALLEGTEKDIDTSRDKVVKIISELRADLDSDDVDVVDSAKEKIEDYKKAGHELESRIEKAKKQAEFMVSWTVPRTDNDVEYYYAYREHRLSQLKDKKPNPSLEAIIDEGKLNSSRFLNDILRGGTDLDVFWSNYDVNVFSKITNAKIKLIEHRLEKKHEQLPQRVWLIVILFVVAAVLVAAAVLLIKGVRFKKRKVIKNDE